jgi:arylsulfatase A-like enzyme/Flp pilus assembly protein TadD
MRGSPGRFRAPALLAAAALLLACDAGGSGEAVERVVLVSFDTLRADHVGCYGAEGAETPALDRLAAEGARFETVISPAPLTLPSHATLLSGRDPPEHGVRHNGLFRLPADVPTLAEQLRAGGFATAAFVSAFVLDGRFGLDRGFDLYDDRLGLVTLAEAGPTGAQRRGDKTVDAALAWLEQAPARFFLWVHLYDPHADYAPPAPFAERFAARPYDGEIAFADAQLARLRAALDARWAGGSLWIASADHGESLGEHGEPTHSYGVYEATQRVPLLIAGPGVPHGRVVAGVAALADVAPTLLDLAGLSPLPGASGRSLAAALAPGAALPERAAWVETLATQLDMYWSPLLGVRTAQHKYVRAPEPELYDLTADPGELENRAAAEPARVAELDRLVAEREAGRPVVPSFTPDAEERARLEALGYLRGGAPAAPAASLGRVGGPDPKRELAAAAQADELQRLLAERRGPEALAAYDALGARGYPLLLMGAAAALLAWQPERAEREARAALALAHQPEPLLAIAKAQLQQERFAEAKQSFEQVLALDPEKSEALLGLGLLAERDGRSEEAAALYERARRAPLASPEAYWRLAALHTEAGRREEARALLAELPQSELRVPEAALRLARAERAAGRTELARTRVAGALKAYPQIPDLWLFEAELRDQAGDLEGALAARREAERIVAERPDVQNALAWTLARLGRDLAEADALAGRALARLGRRPALLDTLACVRVAQGRFADALALADEGLAGAQGTDRVDLLFRRAEALAGLGRDGEGAEALAAAKREAAGRPAHSSAWRESERRVEGLLGRS